MSLLVNHQKQFGFIHIPKTGGTTLTETLKQVDGTEIITSHDSIRLFENVKDYFIFTIVRNPYTKIASAYFAECRKWGDKTFKEFLLNLNENDVWYLPQKYYVTAGSLDDKKVTFIGRYENYTNDVKIILDRIGIKIAIPHLNRNPIYDKHPNIKQHEFYKHLYEEKWMIDWVRERYEDDFKFFN